MKNYLEIQYFNILVFFIKKLTKLLPNDMIIDEGIFILKKNSRMIAQ
ncbi:hypothetical protein CAR_c19330 [Carnobacterium sp. 17-4]|nr:hypothetical protein CAR_c19330 [Carnobacterium sp. 17-4]